MKLRLIILVSLLLLLTVAVVQAQDNEPTETDDTVDGIADCNHPRVAYLTEKSGADCQMILDLRASGIGFGQIMQAVIVAEGVDGDWQELLTAHQEGLGWGQLSKAYGLHKRFADLDATPEELLAWRDSGLGWGQIDKIYALADAGLDISPEQAADMLRNGMEWEEIQAELGLEVGGPPPWAGGPKKNNMPNTVPGNNGNGLGHGNGNKK